MSIVIIIDAFMSVNAVRWASLSRIHKVSPDNFQSRYFLVRTL